MSLLMPSSTMSSSYGCRCSMQSPRRKKTELASRNLPSSSGLMPGFSFTTTRFLDLVVRPSSSRTVVTFSRTPYFSTNFLGLPQLCPSSQHEPRVRPEKQMVHVGGIASGKRSGKTQHVPAGRGERSEGVPLAGGVFELVGLIGDQDIEASLHLLFDVSCRHVGDVLPFGGVRLPQLLAAYFFERTVRSRFLHISPLPYLVGAGKAFPVSP